MRKRTFIFLVGGLLVAGGIWLGREGLTHRALGKVLTNPSPTEEAMGEFLATSGDVKTGLRQLWETRRVQPRLFVLGYLRREVGKDEALWQACRPMVLEACRSLDSEFQETGLELLWDKKDAEAVPTAVAFLRSADPEVRVKGLTKLNFQKEKANAAVFARMLGDADAQVELVAASGLRNVTGEDFGTHMSANGVTPLAGVDKWQEWWGKHAGDFAAEKAGATWSEVPGTETYEFELPDLEGRRVRLAELRGKVVLLSFWATWCPACGGELATLRDLQARHRDDLVVLGINVDGLVDADEHLPTPTAEEVAKTHAEILKMLADAKVTHATLMDPEGKVLGPYGAENLPTNVLIGADGTVKRRLLGTRTLAGWEGLVAAAR